MANERFRFEPLQRHHNRAGFSCGEPDLDEYLKKYARMNADRNVATVFILNDLESSRIAGFYSLASGAVETEDLPENLARKLPRYDIPVSLLARLAVDQDYQGQRLGHKLLFNALWTSLHASQFVGSYGVIVDAKHDLARAFYEKYGFARFPESPYRLVMEMSRIRTLFADARSD